MKFTTFSPTELVIFAAAGIVLIIALAAFFAFHRRRTEKLRTELGDIGNIRAIEESGDRRHGGARPQRHTCRVDRLHIRPLATDERHRFVNSWRDIQAQFVDTPDGAVSAADQLLGVVMCTRGYPVSNFEQREAEISVDSPLVLRNYRAAHEIAVRQSRGDATTAELRNSMVYFRTLFEELVYEPAVLTSKAFF